MENIGYNLQAIIVTYSHTIMNQQLATIAVRKSQCSIA